MGVILIKMEGSSGTTFRMQIRHKGEKWYEPIKGYKLTNSTHPVDKHNNKNILKIVENIVYQRSMELNNEENDVKVVKGNDVLVLDWMDKYAKDYTKKDKRNIEGVINRFRDFLDENEIKRLTFKKLDELMIESFVDYLQSKSVGSGAMSYFKRFKKIVLHAYRTKMMKTNVLDFVTKKPKGKARQRDVLTLEEIELLSKTPTKALEVKRAFIFCCYTGLSWADIKALKWSNIRLEDKMLFYTRKKKEDRYETVSVNINKTAMELLKTDEEMEGLVFNLPSSDGANASIKDWINRAKIKKQITWHNSRHTFGTNLIIQGADIYETANVLGHSDLKMTQLYVQNAKNHNKTITNLLDKKNKK